MIDEARIRELEDNDAYDPLDTPVELEVADRVDVIIEVRLTPEVWRGLLAGARACGLGPGALGAIWIEDRLSAEREASDDAAANSKDSARAGTRKGKSTGRAVAEVERK
jgi:hypothetical protein